MGEKYRLLNSNLIKPAILYAILMNRHTPYAQLKKNSSVQLRELGAEYQLGSEMSDSSSTCVTCAFAQ